MKGQLKIVKRNALGAENTTCRELRKMAGSDEWAAETGYTSSVLHIKTNVSTAREIQQDAEEGLEMFCSNI